MICIGDFIRDNARRVPGRLALVDAERRWTYAELDRQTDAIAAALIARGVEPGDRVGLLGQSSADWVRLFLGIVKSGAIAAGLNYRETPDRLAGMIDDVGIRLMFADPERRAMMAGSGIGAEVLELSADACDALAERRDAAPPPGRAATPSDGAVILFTGGTTGVSKGVLLTHANLFWNVLNEALDTGMNEFDRTLIGTALHHSAALNTWLLPTFYLGGTAVVLREFTPEDWIATMAREQVTNAFTPPTMIRQILRHPLARQVDWSSFRRWYSGAGILPDHERAEMTQLIPGLEIYYEYGLTEAGPIVTVLKPQDAGRAPGSIGRAVRNCEIRILREDRSVADPGEVGELVVRGPAVMPGYFNRPEESARVFLDGWLLTGDLASIDGEGFVFFHDRSKDMIKTGGLNVYSQEVEHVIATHPAVREVAVIGLPDDTWGEAVSAVVTLHDEVTLGAADLVAYARERLGGYQTPKRVIFMPYEALPRNYLGKIIKRDLRDALAEAEVA